MEGNRRPVVEAAQAFVDQRFPDARVALVASSVLRGEGTETSDLDIFVVATRPDAPYRASYREQGWPIEVFVHTADSWRDYFAQDRERRRPTLLMMCRESVVLRDHAGLAARIKAEASELLDQGPPALSAAEVEDYRYAVTDLVDDFVGCVQRDEGILIAHDLAVAAADLILAWHHQWTGQGKWLLRALRRLDPELAYRLSASLLAYAEHGDKAPLLHFADEALRPAGGRLFEGYYLSLIHI